MSIAGMRFRSKNEAEWPVLVGCNGYAMGVGTCVFVTAIEGRRASRVGVDCSYSGTSCLVGVLDWVKNCV